MLAAAKVRGVNFGNPSGAVALRRARKGGEAHRLTLMTNADEFAAAIALVVAEVREQRGDVLRSVAAELNSRGTIARQGGRWHVPNVANLLKRLIEYGKRIEEPARRPRQIKLVW